MSFLIYQSPYTQQHLINLCSILSNLDGREKYNHNETKIVELDINDVKKLKHNIQININKNIIIYDCIQSTYKIREIIQTFLSYINQYINSNKTFSRIDGKYYVIIKNFHYINNIKEQQFFISQLYLHQWNYNLREKGYKYNNVNNIDFVFFNDCSISPIFSQYKHKYLYYQYVNYNLITYVDDDVERNDDVVDIILTDTIKNTKYISKCIIELFNKQKCDITKMTKQIQKLIYSATIPSWNIELFLSTFKNELVNQIKNTKPLQVILNTYKPLWIQFLIDINQIEDEILIFYKNTKITNTIVFVIEEYIYKLFNVYTELNEKIIV